MQKLFFMDNKNLTARAVISIAAGVDAVWDALVNPTQVKKYMFGATVLSDFKEGSSIIWKGEWQGKPYEDKGTILLAEPGKRLKYTHYSALSGKPEIPANYHTITITLSDGDDNTQLVLEQHNNATPQEQEHAEGIWKQMLEALKRVVEAG